MDTRAFQYTEDPFTLTFSPCTRKPLTWKEEVQAIARGMVKDAGSRPIIVCASGGTDSELVCRAFYDQGIYFSVLTVEHAAGTNKEDIAHAQRWCRDRGVEHKLVRLDMAEFMSKSIERYIEQGYIAGNVFRYFQLFLLETVESMGGYAVLGGGGQIYEIANDSPTEKDIYLEYGSGFALPLQWIKQNGNAHRPYFYYSTSEAVLAYLQIPIVDFAVHHPEIFAHKINTYLFKRLVSQALWPDLVPRPKMSGYEEIRELRRETEQKLRARFRDKLQKFRLPIVELRKQLELKL